LLNRPPTTSAAIMKIVTKNVILRRLSALKCTFSLLPHGVRLYDPHGTKRLPFVITYSAFHIFSITFVVPPF
jgi:hypothetical protein